MFICQENNNIDNSGQDKSGHKAVRTALENKTQIW